MIGNDQSKWQYILESFQSTNERFLSVESEESLYITVLPVSVEELNIPFAIVHFWHGMLLGPESTHRICMMKNAIGGKYNSIACEC